MRDIKFRVWDSERKKILPIQRHSFKTGKSMPYGWNMEYVFDDLMQYTGLKDKNGKEIYEGDIVKYKVKGSDKTYTTVMKFNEDHGAFLFGIYKGVKMPCGKKTRMNKYTRKSVGSVEVIGNIYENPELLEGN